MFCINNQLQGAAVATISISANQKTLQYDFLKSSARRTFINAKNGIQNIPEFYISNDCHSPYLAIFHRTKFKNALATENTSSKVKTDIAHTMIHI